MFQPRSWSLAARTSCDQPFFLRHLRTCWPTKFMGGVITTGNGNGAALK